MPEPDDWRRRGQEDYLKGVVVVRRAYRSPPSNPDWDHDHCEFCGAKFMHAGVHDSLCVGFATVDDYYWICGSCFADFHEEFGWRVAQHSSCPANPTPHPAPSAPGRGAG